MCRCTRKRPDLRWEETGSFLPSPLGSPAPSLRSSGSSIAVWSSGRRRGAAAATRCRRAALPMVPHDTMELVGSPVRACSRQPFDARLAGPVSAGSYVQHGAHAGSPPHADHARGRPAPLSASTSRRPALAIRTRSTVAVAPPRTPRSRLYVDMQEEGRAPWMMSSQTILLSR
jgi:hypothetical protein